MLKLKLWNSKLRNSELQRAVDYRENSGSKIAELWTTVVAVDYSENSGSGIVD
jgi:hypothetical protein